MDIILRISGIAIIGAILAVSIKQRAPEFSMLVALAAAGAALALTLSLIQPVKEFILELTGAAGLETAVLGPVIKGLGIAILTKLCSDACLDAGERAISTVVETAGAAAAVYVALPLMSSVFRLITSLA